MNSSFTSFRFLRISLFSRAASLALIGGVAFSLLSPVYAAAPAANGAKGKKSSEQAFTPKQRAEIVQIMRDALKQDPSILTDAILAIREKSEAASTAEITKNLQENQDAFMKANPQTIWGNPEAKLTITAFLDPRCGYCKRMVPTLNDYIKAHPDVRIIERQVPLLGEQSVLAVKAIFAAEQQGHYKEMRTLIMQANQVDSKQIDQFAAQLKLNMKRFHADLSDQKVEKEMAENIRLSHLAHMEGTPYFLFGNMPVPGGLTLEEMNELTKQLK